MMERLCENRFHLQLVSSFLPVHKSVLSRPKVTVVLVHPASTRNISNEFHDSEADFLLTVAPFSTEPFKSWTEPTKHCTPRTNASERRFTITSMARLKSGGSGLIVRPLRIGLVEVRRNFTF